MPGRKYVMQPVGWVYRYDGGLKGFYSCVFEAMALRQMPLDIVAEDQPSLLADRWVETDEIKAQRVRAGIERNIGARALELVEVIFLSCLEDKEMALLRFLLLGFEQGPRVVEMLARPEVMVLLQAEKSFFGEAHLLKGFVRFSDYDGKLVATIGPKNFVLPFLAQHFAERFSQETFMIYDEKHHAALIHHQGQTEIVQMESIAAFQPGVEEERYRSLWRQFYRTIAIEARINPRCRMGHMPKRFWAYMTELSDQV